MKLNLNNSIVLENELVKLELLEEKHFIPLLPIALDEPDLLRFSPSPFGNEEQLRENFNIAFSQRKKQKRYAFAIFDKKKRKYAGSTSIGEISEKDLRLQIGWTWMGKEFRGTGLNKICKFLLLRYIFEDLQYKRVEFVTDSRNFRSRRAIESIGGKQEGELRSHLVMPDGYRRNTIIFSILKEEWKDLKQEIFSNQNVD